MAYERFAKRSDALKFGRNKKKEGAKLTTKAPIETYLVEWEKGKKKK